MHNGNIFFVHGAGRFYAINKCLQLPRYALELSSGERTTVVRAEKNLALYCTVMQIRRQLSTVEFLLNLILCHWWIGFYVLVDIVRYIPCCIHINILNRSIV